MTADVTTWVATVNVADVAPWGTVTVTGTVPIALLIARLTIDPPAGAGADKVTVPVVLVPPTTDVGDIVSPSSVACSSVSVAVPVLAPIAAVIVADTGETTAEVVTVKVADVAPAAIATVAGTETYPEFDLSENVSPPTGAALAKVTAPVTDVPPITEVGDTETAKLGAGSIFSNSVIVVEPWVARISAETGLETDEVAIVNDAEVAPAGMVTEVGVVACVFSDPRKITTPPAPAGPFKVTVPATDWPPITVYGVRDRLTRAAGLTFRAAPSVVPPCVALIVATVDVDTPVVVIANVLKVAPAAIVTELGTDALELFEDNLTTTPPAPAGAFRATVPTVPAPPMTELGFTVIPDIVGVVIVREPLFDELPNVAVIVAVTLLRTVLVSTVNVAVVAPPKTYSE